jgi:acyl-CoA synthetase (AMP-forming)/AMP-acid ligase II
MRADERYVNIPRMALHNAERFAPRTAIVDGDLRMTFADVGHDLLAVARGLVARGVEPGDRIALWAPNSAAWIPTALGILATGACLVPINTRFKAAEAAYVLETVDAGVLCIAEGVMGLSADGLRAVRPGLRALADPVELPGPGVRSSPSLAALVADGDAVPEDLVRGRVERIDANDVSDIMFTSGTTGHPKGVMLRHGTSLRGYESYNERLGVGEHDRVLVALPFFHCFGYKAGWMVDLMVGATTCIQAVFDARAAMEMIQAERITSMPGAPTMFWAFLNDPSREEFDLSSLQTVVVAAAAIPVELVRRLRSEMDIPTTATGYGLTENHALVSVTLADDPPEVVSSTVGKVFPDLEVRVVDDAGHDLDLGEEGELLVRGYMHMTGYYGDPEATEAAFTDGWLRTGDIGTLDEHDYVRITDRKKDMYIMGGFNVSPAEVESVLSEHPTVGQVAVIGVPDERFGEVGAAYVVARPGEEPAEDELLAFAAARIANYKVPRAVRVVDALPMNATGKVLKGELRDCWRAETPDRV